MRQAMLNTGESPTGQVCSLNRSHLPEGPQEVVNGALLRSVERLGEGTVLVHGVDVESKRYLADRIERVPVVDDARTPRVSTPAW
jgi:hypothetical protein